MPLTANFHFIRSCNFRCGYCYATFRRHRGPPRPARRAALQHHPAARPAVHEGHVRRRGAHPLPAPARHARDHQGRRCAHQRRHQRLPHRRRMARTNAGILDFLTLSIDSDDPATHRAMGRAPGWQDPAHLPLPRARGRGADLGIGVKINTVVTTLNASEDLASLFVTSRPSGGRSCRPRPSRVRTTRTSRTSPRSGPTSTPTSPATRPRSPAAASGSLPSRSR